MARTASTPPRAVRATAAAPEGAAPGAPKPPARKKPRAAAGAARRSSAPAASTAAAKATAPAPAPARRRGRPHYHVYVIALSDEVLTHPRFLRCNPDYVTGKPCVYVGMTGLDPDVRFDKHKAGIQANRYVLRYGQHLLPDLYEGFNPMRYDEAVAREIEIGIDLRSAGWGVWQA